MVRIQDQLESWDRQEPIPGLMHEDEFGCWIWERARNGAGYAVFWFNGRQIYVTRFLLNIHNQDWRLTDDVAGHFCNNGRLGCVRPDHLEIQTKSQDVRQVRDSGAGTYNQVLTESDVREIRSRLRWDGTRYQFVYRGQCKDLAREFGVHPTTITCTATGYSWPWT